VGAVPASAWLAIDRLLAQFAKRRSVAQQRYATFVIQGIKANSPWSDIKGQVFLGDQEFVKRVQIHLQTDQEDIRVPLAHRRALAPSLSEIERQVQDRNAAIATAHATGAYSYHQIAEHFGLHFTTVGRIVRPGG
jgi:putative transposase